MRRLELFQDLNDNIHVWWQRRPPGDPGAQPTWGWPQIIVVVGGHILYLVIVAGAVALAVARVWRWVLSDGPGES